MHTGGKMTQPLIDQARENNNREYLGRHTYKYTALFWPIFCKNKTWYLWKARNDAATNRETSA